MYRWCDGGHALGSVVHLGTFHYVMMSSICLSFGYKPPSRLWKPPKSTNMVSLASDQNPMRIRILCKVGK